MEANQLQEKISEYELISSYTKRELDSVKNSMETLQMKHQKLKQEKV